MEPCSEYVMNDVVKLVEIFRECFFTNGVIKENSTIVLHPTFSTHTSPVGIADLFADGILYDFKASKKNGFKWHDVGQVYGYYILHRLCMKYDRDAVLTEPVPIKRIGGIALYYSRYGDIETCDLKNCNAELKSQEIERIANMMDQHWRESHADYLESMKLILAQAEWRKLVFSRESKGLRSLTPEDIDYAVGDTVYEPSHGKGEVVKFTNKDGFWHVILSFESGQELMGNINQMVLFNWSNLENHELLQDTSHYFR